MLTKSINDSGKPSILNQELQITDKGNGFAQIKFSM